MIIIMTLDYTYFKFKLIIMELKVSHSL